MSNGDTTYNEGTSLKVTAAFRDEDGAPVVPNEWPQWRLDDVDTGTPIVDWRDMGPTLAASMEFDITKEHNDAHGNTRRYWRRRITVRFEFGPPGSPIAGATEEYDYRVKNLTFL